MSTCTHIPSLLSILACAYCMSTSTQCLVDNNMNVCIHNPSQRFVCTSTCIHTSTTMCACPPKPHVRTCLLLLHVCPCQSPTQALNNNLNESPFTWKCTYMSASALIQVNILCVHKQALSMHIYNKVCPVLFASPQKHQWTCTYMSAFVPSTLQLMHCYMSIVNTMPRRQ